MRRHLCSGLLVAVVGAAGFATAQESSFLPREAFGQVVFGRVQSGGESTVRPEAAFGALNFERIGRYAPDSGFGRLGRSVGLLHVLTDRGVSYCTAFVLDERHVMTNHHCLTGLISGSNPPAARIEAVQLMMGFLEDGIAEGTIRFEVDLRPVEEDAMLDFAVLEVPGGFGDGFDPLPLAAVDPVPDNQPLWLIGHPAGWALRISREECASATPALSGQNLRHTCDTLQGNSGSPVIDPDLRAVVALHYADGGGQFGGVNLAIPVAAIAQKSEIVASLTAAAPRPSDGTGDAESLAAAYWADLKDSDDPEMLEHFAVRFEGTFPALLAVRRLGELEADAARIACEQAAAFPFDPENPLGVEGVYFLVLIDNHDAIDICDKAVQSNPDDPRLGGLLARAIFRAIPDERDDARAFDLATAAVDAGHVPSMVVLAYLTETGRGTGADEQRAGELLEQAAREGAPGALYWMGVRSIGDPSDINAWDEAVEYFAPAAAQGFAPAAQTMAELHVWGVGVPMDPAKSEQILLDLIDDGYELARFSFGSRILEGVFPDRDRQEALRQFDLLAEAGIERGLRDLVFLYQSEIYWLDDDDEPWLSPEDRRARLMHVLDLATDKGSPWAHARLGRLYEEVSPGTDESRASAIQHYEAVLALAPPATDEFRNASERLKTLRWTQDWLQSLND